MPDQMIVQYCSPTLAGLKTGNMFSICFASHAEMVREIRDLNAALKEKGLRAIPLRRKNGRCLVYIYRPSFLRTDLKDPAARTILKERGYTLESTEGCLAQLAVRVEQNKDFPHEIGLFLGYPPSDVRAFIKNPNEGVANAGCWKAYGDPQKAERIFRIYRKCTDLYRREVDRGRTVGQLAVCTESRRAEVLRESEQ